MSGSGSDAEGDWPEAGPRSGDEPDGVRVQVVLARAGVASRRAADRLVADGRVSVNGRRAELGQRVRPEDDLRLDGEAVRAEPVRTYLLHKAAGTVSTASDPEGRPTVLDALPTHLRLYPVGRLDYNTTGALLVTNDGELAHRLMHPRYAVPKVYLATVSGAVSADALRRLRQGVRLEDGPTRPAEVEIVGRPRPTLTELRIGLTEGRNRQVRRMIEAVGHQVVRLARTRYDGLELGHLKPGEWRALRRDELVHLRESVGLER